VKSSLSIWAARSVRLLKENCRGEEEKGDWALLLGISGTAKEFVKLVYDQNLFLECVKTNIFKVSCKKNK